jgi:hypothetical protein
MAIYSGIDSPTSGDRGRRPREAIAAALGSSGRRLRDLGQRRHASAYAGAAHARMSRGGGARRGTVHTCDAVLHRSRIIHRILHDRVIATND